MTAFGVAEKIKILILTVLVHGELAKKHMIAHNTVPQTGIPITVNIKLVFSTPDPPTNTDVPIVPF